MNIKVLIVDDSEDIVEILSFYLEEALGSLEILKAYSGKAASILIDQNPDLSFVICDYNMPNGNGGEVFTHFRKTSKNIFIVHSSDSLEMHPEFNGAENLKYLPKPMELSEFRQTIHESIDNVPSLTSEQISFVAVSLTLLRRMGKTPTPMYYKLSENNFVRACHENHIFDEAEINKLEIRKISRLYIERALFSKFLTDFQSRFTAIVDKAIAENAPEAGAIARSSLAFLEQARDQLGLTPEIQTLTNKNITIVLTLLEKNPHFKNVLNEWKSSEDSFFADRSTLIALIATSISTKLKWVSELTSQKLVFASMLHDVSLTPEERRNQQQLIAAVKDPLKSRDKATQSYRQHSIFSAEVVRKWPLCPPDVDTIIAQHHESADGQGFPMKLNHTRIAPLSTVFILSQDLADYVIQSGGKKKLNEWINERRKHYDHGEFKKVFQVLLQ
jgi:response regulator RpfG family c-di-GMP phosphodiesterase